MLPDRRPRGLRRIRGTDVHVDAGGSIDRPERNGAGGVRRSAVGSANTGRAPAVQPLHRGHAHVRRDDRLRRRRKRRGGGADAVDRGRRTLVEVRGAHCRPNADRGWASRDRDPGRHGLFVRVLDIPDETLNLPCVVWSPYDARLVCQGWDDGDPTRSGIDTVQSSDGGDVVRVTTPPGGMTDFPGDWSSNDDIVFNRASGDSYDGPLLLVKASGGDPSELMSTSVANSGCFSPDGTSRGDLIGRGDPGRRRDRFRCVVYRCFGLIPLRPRMVAGWQLARLLRRQRRVQGGSVRVAARWPGDVSGDANAGQRDHG